MSRPHRMIQVGTGGFGGCWCRDFLPPSVADGLVEVAAAVDIDPGALANAREHLGLTDEQCFTDLAEAFDRAEAEFCSIVVPPAFHETVVDLALAHDMHILSEKPIADSMEAAARIARKVGEAGTKMGVTMSHRFDRDKASLRRELRSGRWGEVDYLVCRFATDARAGGSYPRYVHEEPQPLLVDMAVHHLDIVADLAGRPCATLFAETWRPAWAEYAGPVQGLVTMTFEDGPRAVYEAANANAVELNGWANEYVRAECESATVVLDRRTLEVHERDASGARRRAAEGEGRRVPLIEQPKWGHTWLIEQFVDWLEGGEPMETNVNDNLRSLALVFAAIESSASGAPVDVREFLRARSL